MSEHISRSSQSDLVRSLKLCPDTNIVRPILYRLEGIQGSARGTWTTRMTLANVTCHLPMTRLIEALEARNLIRPRPPMAYIRGKREFADLAAVIAD
jgi:hypothetical protein